jgi:hypothetical protein
MKRRFINGELDILRDLVPEDSRRTPQRLAHVLALAERCRKEITAALMPPKEAGVEAGYR